MATSKAQRIRVALPWLVGPLLGLTAATWAASRPPISIPLAAAGGGRLVPGGTALIRPGASAYVVGPAEVDPRFVVPKSADIDPRIVVDKSAEVDPRILAASPAGPPAR